MQDSGLSEMRQSMPNNHHPVYPPWRNIKVSPTSIAAMAPDRAYGAGNAPRALAPPAISKASAAGTGNPIASRNTAANRITMPCAARFEIQESMTVRAVLWFEISYQASLRPFLFRRPSWASFEHPVTNPLFIQELLRAIALQQGQRREQSSFYAATGGDGYGAGRVQDRPARTGV